MNIRGYNHEMAHRVCVISNFFLEFWEIFPKTALESF